MHTHSYDVYKKSEKGDNLIKRFEYRIKLIIGILIYILIELWREYKVVSTSNYMYIVNQCFSELYHYLKLSNLAIRLY